MPPAPFTHHEIFSLIGPFSRQGYQPDLGASDRLERRLLFKPIVHLAPASEATEVTEILQLKHGENGIFSLTRRLIALRATYERFEAELLIDGPDIGELIERIKSIPLETHFQFGQNFGIAKNYRIQPELAGPLQALPLNGLILTRASAFVEGVTVTMVPPKLKVDADCLIELRPKPGELMNLPDDFLAVLGWNFGLLRRLSQGFKANLRITGSEPERSRVAERKLDQMIDHLSITLAAPPAQFHNRLLGARWLVALRRSIPLLIALILLGGAIATLNTDFAQNSPFRMWMFNGPPLLLIGIFCMREIPSIEVPPIPGPSLDPSWRQPSPTPAADHSVQPERGAASGFYFRR